MLSLEQPILEELLPQDKSQVLKTLPVTVPIRFVIYFGCAKEDK